MSSKAKSMIKSFFDEEADGGSDTSDGSEGDEPNEYDRTDAWVNDKPVKDRKSARSLDAAQDEDDDDDAEALGQHYETMYGSDVIDDSDDDAEGDNNTSQLDPVMEEIATGLRQKAASKADKGGGPTCWTELEKTTSIESSATRGTGSKNKRRSGAAKSDDVAAITKELTQAFKGGVTRQKVQMHLKIKDAVICDARTPLVVETANFTQAQLRDELTKRECAGFCRRDAMGFYLDENKPRAFLDLATSAGVHIYLFVTKDMMRRLWPAEHIHELRAQLPLLSPVLARMASALDVHGEDSILAWDTLLKQGERCPLIHQVDGKIAPRFDATFLLELLKSEASRAQAAPPPAQPKATAPPSEASPRPDDMDTKEAAAVAKTVVTAVDKTVAQATSDFADAEDADPAPEPKSAGADAKKKSKARASAASRLATLMENVVQESKKRSGHSLMAMKIADEAKVVYFREEGVTDADEIAMTVKAIKRFSESHNDFKSGQVPFFITADPMPARAGQPTPAANAQTQASVAPAAGPARVPTTSRYMTSKTADAARAKAAAAAAQKEEADIGRWIVLRGSADYELMERTCKTFQELPGGLATLDTEGIFDIMEGLKDMPMKSPMDLKKNMQALANEYSFMLTNILLALASVFTIRDEPGLEERMPMIASMMKGSDPASSLASKAGFVYETIATNARAKASQEGHKAEPMTKAIRNHAALIFEKVRETEHAPLPDEARRGLLVFYACFLKK